MSEVIHLLGEGGGVFEMTLPLDRHIARRYAEGELLRVNPDGSEYEEPEEAADDGGDGAAADDGGDGGDGAAADNAPPPPKGGKSKGAPEGA